MQIQQRSTPIHIIHGKWILLLSQQQRHQHQQWPTHRGTTNPPMSRLFPLPPTILPKSTRYLSALVQSSAGGAGEVVGGGARSSSPGAAGGDFEFLDFLDDCLGHVAINIPSSGTLPYSKWSQLQRPWWEGGEICSCCCSSTMRSLLQYKTIYQCKGGKQKQVSDL